MFCRRCGVRLLEGAEFCNKCGTRVFKKSDETPREPAIETQKSNSDLSETVENENAVIESGVPSSEQELPDRFEEEPPVENPQPERISPAPRPAENYAVKQKFDPPPIFLFIAIGAAVVAMIFAMASNLPKDKSKSPTKLGVLSESSLSESSVRLKEKFTSAEGRFSVEYSSDWHKVSDDVSFVKFASRDGTAEFRVLELYDDSFNIYYGTESSVRRDVNEFHTFVYLKSITLGGVHAKKMQYKTSWNRVVNNIVYYAGDTLYMIVYSYPASDEAIHEPIFNAMLESYSISSVLF